MDYRLMPYSGCVAQRHSNHCGMATGVSKKASVFHNVMCLSITLTVLFIQMDELWSFLKNKKSQLWVFVGFEVDSRFWMNFELGSRTTHTATKLVTQIKHYIGKLSRLNPVKVMSGNASKCGKYACCIHCQSAAFFMRAVVNVGSGGGKV